jgi:hypothetical protein
VLSIWPLAWLIAFTKNNLTPQAKIGCAPHGDFCSSGVLANGLSYFYLF